MSRQRGLALVSVLWGVAILSLIAAAMLSASVTSAHLDRNGWNAARAGSVADQAVSRAILSLLDDRVRIRPRVDARPQALTFDGVPVRLWIQDESGRININFAPKDVLQSLFASAGLERGDAGTLADRIVARQTPAGAPNAHIAFRSTDELLAVPGMTPTLLARIEPLITVYGKAPVINRQVAPRAVLRLLPDLDDQGIDRLIKERDATPAPPDDTAPGSPLGLADTVFAVTAQARVGDAQIVRLAVVQFTGDVTKPYLILAWR
jgi:general secretion pathway protein K